LENLLEEMIAARERAVVQKTALITFRSFDPDTVVFVFEGVDDKIVYSKWIGRLRPDLRYEPLPCGNKKKALGLHDAVLRDRNGLGRGVYFFVDRDFDDLQDCQPHETIFMTDFYSVENYLVSPSVVEEVLKTDFHCHGRPDIRGPIISHFQKALSDFNQVSEAVNRRLFVARRAKLDTGSAPSKVKDFANISIEQVSGGPKSADELIVYNSEPSPEKLSELHSKFDELSPIERYRGKYLKAFLDKWLELLSADYVADPSIHFSQISRVEKVKQSEFQLGGLASKSPVPVGLPDFLQTVSSA